MSAHRLFYVLGQRVDLGLCDGAVLACANEPRDDLVPIECFLDVVAFDHEERNLFGSLESRVSTGAAEALPAPADSTALFGDARVDDLVFLDAAVGAPHSSAFPGYIRGPQGSFQTA